MSERERERESDLFDNKETVIMKCTSMSEEDTVGKRGKAGQKRVSLTREKEAASWRESSGNNFPVPCHCWTNGRTVTRYS